MSKTIRLNQMRAKGAIYGLDETAYRDCQNMRIGIVASKFNSAVVDLLLESALETLISEKGVVRDGIQIYRVPGAFEIPLIAQKIAGQFDAMIALGCVVRGETAHFDQVVAACRQGIVEVMLKEKKPIAYGILAVDTQQQAEARSEAGSPLNRGTEAARAAVDMYVLMNKL